MLGMNGTARSANYNWREVVDRTVFHHCYILLPHGTLLKFLPIEMEISFLSSPKHTNTSLALIYLYINLIKD